MLTYDRSEILLDINYDFDLENIMSRIDFDSYRPLNLGAERFSLNMLFYMSSLDASNQFDLGSTFKQQYKYDTKGAKISLNYDFTPKHCSHKLWAGVGLLYTVANLNFEEYKSGNLQPYYVDSSVNALGYNMGIGYRYAITNQMQVRVIADWYKVDFGDINVMSRTQGFLDTAHFQENTTSIRFGIAYKL